MCEYEVTTNHISIISFSVGLPRKLQVFFTYNIIYRFNTLLLLLLSVYCNVVQYFYSWLVFKYFDQRYQSYRGRGGFKYNFRLGVTLS